MNANKTKTLIVSRSCSTHLMSRLLTIGGSVLNESVDLHILGVTLDSKMTFEKHLHSVSRAASRRLVMLRISWRVRNDRLLRIRWCVTGGFQEQGQCFFIGLSCSISTIVSYSFSLSLLSVYWLVLWGWRLRTDTVYIILYQPCTTNLF